MKTEDIKQLVKRRYSIFAERGGGQSSCCCSTNATGFAAEHGLYSQRYCGCVYSEWEAQDRAAGTLEGER